MAYDRYASVRTEGGFRTLPFGEIPKSKTDRIIIYRKGQMGWIEPSVLRH